MHFVLHALTVAFIGLLTVYLSMHGIQTVAQAFRSTSADLVRFSVRRFPVSIVAHSCGRLLSTGFAMRTFARFHCVLLIGSACCFHLR